MFKNYLRIMILLVISSNIFVFYGHGMDQKEKDKKLIQVVSDPMAGYKLDEVEALISSGANVNAIDENGKTPLLIVFSRLGSTPPALKLAKLLLENKADINAQDNEGNTVLIYAIPNIAGIEFLLGYQGIDVNLRNKNGDTALSLAKDWQRTHLGSPNIGKVIELLKSAGAE